MGIDASAWLGFGGVLLGGALGYASSAVQEAARRRHERARAAEQAEREDRVRFEDRRFDAYVAMVTAANRVHAAIKHPLTTDPAAYTAQLHSAYEQFRTSLSPAFLLAASTDTRDRIAELAAVTADLREAAEDRSAPPLDPATAELVPLYGAQRRALKAAEAAMRAEFGLHPLAPRFPTPSPRPAPSSAQPSAAPANPDPAAPADAGEPSDATT
jgi:hypothetical protein